MRRTLATLRARLITASLAAFLLVVGLAILNLAAARSARAAVAAAQLSYDRVALYTRLDYAATAFENSAISAAAQQPGADGVLVPARARFVALLGQAGRARFQTAEEEAARTRIVAEAHAVLAAFERPEERKRLLEAIELAHGTRAVAAEIARLRAPYDTLRSYLAKQIETGDAEVAAGTRRAIALSHSSTTAAILGLTAVLMVIAAIMLTLLRRLRGGLARLETGARALGSGALAHRIALGGRDELAALSDAFDTMAADLQAQQAALKAANVNLEAMVSTRTADLIKANESLAAEDRHRRAFLADVGHELRTPLTIIRGEAQLALRAADPGGVDHGRVYERILDQTHDLERLVDDLFLIARAEGGGLKLQRRPTDLGELVRRVAGDFEALATEGHAAISARAGPPVEADVDPDRVRQMMAALIDNALRHTHAGVAIEVAAEASAEGPRITVSDNGPGVPPELAEGLFSRFRRGDTQSHGSGLGLAVVRALAEAHGGAAGLENRPSGGARAWLSFPIPTAPAPS
jgi:signal transduction histidine kinase